MWVVTLAGLDLGLQLLKSINASKYAWNIEEVVINIHLVLEYCGSRWAEWSLETHRKIRKSSDDSWGRTCGVFKSFYMDMIGNIWEQSQSKWKLCREGSEHSGVHSFPIPTHGYKRDTGQLGKWGGVVKILEPGLRGRELRPGTESQSLTQGISVAQ